MSRNTVWLRQGKFLASSLAALVGLGALLSGRPFAAESPGAAPAVQFATFYGGNDYDRAQGCTVDKDGYIYITGNTRSSNLRALGLTTAGAFHPDKYQTAQGWAEADAFVAKLSPDGRQVVWGTYLGGNRQDRGYGVRVDPQGNVYVVGITESTDFPATSGAFQTTQADRSSAPSHEKGDIFVAKFKPDGSGLIFATYIGGAEQDWSRGGMWIQPDGSLYASGHSASPNFPTTSKACQKSHASDNKASTGAPRWDGVVFHLSADGRQLLESTYLGGNGHDSLYSGLIVHSDGTVYVAGMTSSTNQATTPKAFQRAYSGDSGGGGYTGDGMVARFSADLSTLVYCTYLGGREDDNVVGNESLAVDPAGRAVVALQTKSPNFPTTPGAYDRAHTGATPGADDGAYPGPGKLDGAIAILSADGTSLAASTFLGGSGSEELSGIALDPSGNVYISGNTGSKDYPTTPDALQKAFGGGNTDAVFTVLKPDLTGLLYSTFLGGGGTSAYGDRGRSLVLAPQGRVILSGDTNSPDFPVSSPALQETYGGGSADAFVIQLSGLRVP